MPKHLQNEKRLFTFAMQFDMKKIKSIALIVACCTILCGRTAFGSGYGTFIMGKSHHEYRDYNNFLKELKSIKKHSKKKNIKKKKDFPFAQEIIKLRNQNYSKFLQSKYWKWIREQVFKRDNYTCTVCGSKKDLRVHHTTYKNHFKEHKHLKDLLTCCDLCHTEFHTYCEVI
jgi:hypothetical protein